MEAEPLDPSALGSAPSGLRARSRTRGAWLRIVPLFMVLAGCATGGNVALPEHEGPGERHFRKEEIPLPDLQPDPLEPLNRTMSLVNDESATAGLASFESAMPRVSRRLPSLGEAPIT